MTTLSNFFQLVRNMGFRYISYRAGFELNKKLGLIKRNFPTSPPFKEFISLQEWREKSFFFGIDQTDQLNSNTFQLPDIAGVLKGDINFFSSKTYPLGRDYDWTTNPDSGFKYDSRCHWTDIQDYSHEAGDIKFVWEKSRFAYLFQVIRHDHFATEDHSKWVFSEIESWLSANPINCGPNYKCSQEISLRVLNWTYALNFYKDSEHLTAELFAKVIHAIYWQIKHVYSNINFSRIAVRNNHALTETLAIYLCSLYYPFFPDARKWRLDGKKWFEEEVDYQIYEDGTFLQFSMNYHRVAIQLFTWAFRSAEFFNERFSEVVYDKAYKSLKFLLACQDVSSGWLPNYGNNDGALFFKFNACDFRDFRPQLNALHVLLTGEKLYVEGDWDEDLLWLNARKCKDVDYPPIQLIEGWQEFKSGGYYVLREFDALTFIRCGDHRDRPAQADNLHLDLWHNGQNIAFDGGSYKYNTNPSTLKYFMGTESHNTVMLGNEDQMVKGERFIWYNWSQAIKASTSEDAMYYVFEGEISAFSGINPDIRHHRKVIKKKGTGEWIVEDTIINKPESLYLKQLWHVLPNVSLSSRDGGVKLLPATEKRWRSDYYAVKDDADQYVFETLQNRVSTIIQCK